MIDLLTATDAELLQYSRAGRARDAGDEPPVPDEGDEEMLVAIWQELGRAEDDAGREPGPDDDIGI